MKTLFINATTKDSSRILLLAKHLIDKYINKDINNNKDNDYIEIDLSKDIIPNVDDHSFEIKYDHLHKGDIYHPCLKNATLLKEAELIIIAAPIWNLSFPSSLKAFLDDSILTNYTFKYGPLGNIISMTNTKKVILVSNSGGPYLKKYSYDYIKSISKTFLNTSDVILFKAEYLDVFKGCVEKILSKTISKIDRYFSKHPIK